MCWTVTSMLVAILVQSLVVWKTNQPVVPVELVCDANRSLLVSVPQCAP